MRKGKTGKIAALLMAALMSAGAACAATITPGTDASLTGTGTMSITLTVKPRASVTTAPVAKTLTYNGTAQALVNAGVSSSGVMLYSLDGKNTARAFPQARTRRATRFITRPAAAQITGNRPAPEMWM